jgi:hypothetical protein
VLNVHPALKWTLISLAVIVALPFVFGFFLFLGGVAGRIATALTLSLG